MLFLISQPGYFTSMNWSMKSYSLWEACVDGIVFNCVMLPEYYYNASVCTNGKLFIFNSPNRSRVFIPEKAKIPIYLDGHNSLEALTSRIKTNDSRKVACNC